MRSRDPRKEKAVRAKALVLLVKEGFDGFSMQKLAKAAKVSPATLYIYYKDRDDLIFSLHDEVVKRMVDISLDGFDPDLPFPEGLAVQWRNRKRFWLDAHNVIGIASLPFHIVISLTVIVFAFHDQFYDSLQHVVYGEQKMWSRPAGAPGPGDASKLAPASELVRRAQQAAPGFEVTEMLFMDLESPRPLVRVGVAKED